MGLLKKSHFSALAGSGKSTFHITKEFTLQQVFRQCCAVNCHKRTVFPAAGIVNALGKEFFSCSGLAHDDNIGIRFRIALCHFNGPINNFALMKDIIKGIAGL